MAIRLVASHDTHFETSRQMAPTFDQSIEEERGNSFRFQSEECGIIGDGEQKFQFSLKID